MTRFARYALVGIGNTLVHWLTFLLIHFGLGFGQGPSNLLAFSVAASLSYYINAHFTFAVRPAGQHYLMFLLGMGGLSLSLGALSDWAGLSPWLTLVSFSAVSLIVGYSFSLAVVFRRRGP